MFTKVLVPLDGSALSERALGPALEVAKKPGGQVTLLRVPVPQPLFIRSLEGMDPYVEQWAEQMHAQEREEAAAYLDEMRAANRRDDVVLTSTLVDGDTPDVILDAAVDHDLVVMSTHGRSGFSKLMMGSVTERVLAAAPCPVLVVRAATPIRRILIPLDGSPLAEAALAPGLELALRLEAEVTLLRVADEVRGFESVQLGQTDIANRVQDGLVHEAESYLGSLLVPPSEALKLTRKVLVGHGVGPRIVEFAQQHRIDLIVMATHGRTGLARWVYGSVAEKVVRGAQCSMLVIRPQTHRLG